MKKKIKQETPTAAASNQEKATELLENVVEDQATRTSVYKGAARIGTDKDDLANGDTTKLSLIQEAALAPEERKVLKLMLRGYTRVTISKVMGKSLSNVIDTQKNIRRKLSTLGENVDQNYLIGYTVSVYEEVEEKAWELYGLADNAKSAVRDKSKALELVMKAREKQLKLIMDVGLVQKAENVVNHEVTLSPFLESWGEGDKQSVVKAMVESTLDKLEDPVAPDAEYTGTNTPEKEEDE